METEKAIIIVDGACNLCNAALDFIMKRDRRGRFRTDTLQSPTSRELIRKHALPASTDSVLLIYRNKVFIKSDAVIEIVNNLPYPWRILRYARFIPKQARDFIYDFVAKHRYLVFGKNRNCNLPVSGNMKVSRNA